MNIKRFVYYVILLLPSFQLHAQTPGELTATIKSLDSLLFEVGFNQCEMTPFETLVSDDFEFYHDEAGMLSSKASFIRSMKERVCGQSYKAKRVLDANSVHTYPLKKNEVLYGAIQTGVHRFYAIEAGQPERLTSVARFTHLWLLGNGKWKLSRGLSYDHQEKDVTNEINEQLLFVDRTETEKWIIKKRIPTLGIGFIRDGKIKEATVYGVLENGRSAPANTLFNVASLTKPITALIALKLVEAGKWNLDEPVYLYWTDPDVASDPRSRKLTTRHILSHQSGFPNWRFKTKDGLLRFEFEPGTRFQYSGEGYEYLRRALEKKTGKTLDQLASELIFKPLGMKDTRFYWDNQVDEARFAKGHSGDGTPFETYKNNSANAADDLLTTVEDYSKFMLHIMNGAGLSKELYSQMISMQVPIKTNKYAGLGWMVDENIGNGEIAINHGGDDKGVHTIAFMLPKSGRGLLIFTNCDNGTDIYVPTVLHFLGTEGQGIIDVETK